MFFRKQYILKNFPIKETDKIRIHLIKKPNEPIVEIRLVTNEEITKNINKDDTICTVTIIKPITLEIQNLFLKIDKNIPEELKPLIDELYKEIPALIMQIFRILRWKRGTAKRSRPASYSNLEYSVDGENWKTIPSQIFLKANWGFPQEIEISEEFRTNFINLLENDMEEPLAHELFCESWDQKENNPRSSLIIGIAAAETGFKDLVRTLTPDAAWLISELPSPPLIKMLEEYLPKLPTKFVINKKVLPPPQNIIKILRKGIKIRNDIVHGKSHEINPDTLSEILHAVRDLLYLIDIYSGNKWAEKRISIGTMREMIEMSKLKNVVENEKQSQY